MPLIYYQGIPKYGNATLCSQNVVSFHRAGLPLIMPSNSSLATRAKLLAVAEEQFAARGLESVTLSEITKAAGQRN